MSSDKETPPTVNSRLRTSNGGGAKKYLPHLFEEENFTRHLVDL